MSRYSRATITFQPLVRAVAVIAAVAAAATGVTFAALQSQTAALTGNTISTATADLKIGTTASSFGATRAGFAFNGVIPGGSPAPADGNTFYLKSNGTPLLALKAAVTSSPTNASNVDLTKVFVVLTRLDTNASQKLALADLVGSNTNGGLALTDQLAGGAVAQYKVQVQMSADAFTGTNADIGGFDLVFSGTAVTQ